MGEWSTGSEGARSIVDMPDQVDGADIANSSTIESLRDLLLEAFNWNYLTLVQPAGVATAAALLYQFDGSGAQLTDRSASGADLVLQAGATRNAKRNASVGLVLSGERYESAVAAPAQLSAALTLEIVVHFGDISTTSDILMACGGGLGETAPDNVLWMIYVEALTGKLVFFSESGSGVDDNVVSDLHVISGSIQHLTVTRNGSTGLLSFYQNGLLIGTKASTLPTGGGNGFVLLGSQFGGGESFHGICFSAKLTAEEFTAAQVTESHRRVKGLIA